MRYPPGVIIFMADSIISRCSEAHCATSPSLHCFLAVSSLRIMPSPEHGASIATMSKYPFNPASFDTSVLVITMSGYPYFVRFSLRIFARADENSLASIRLPSGNAFSMAVVLPPGAAHRSATLTGALSVICPTIVSYIMDDASCT